MRAFLIASLAVAFASAAYACPPPPPPPPPPPEAEESEEAYRARAVAWRQNQLDEERAFRLNNQQRAWNEADLVFIARVVRTDTINQRGWTSPRAHLRPVRWIKGSGGAHRFSLRYEGATTCGPYGGGEAVAGEVGEEFVVFMRAGRPNQSRLIASFAPASLLDPEMRARVAPAE